MSRRASRSDVVEQVQSGRAPRRRGRRVLEWLAGVIAMPFAIALGACASAPSASSAPQMAPQAAAQASAAVPCDVERDRAAIRAMAGEFHVTFAFDETEALAPGYVPREPYRAEGSEVVEILEETPHKIVLQHVLLIPSPDGKTTPQKHWRQDWTFEDPTLVEFRGHRAFAHRQLTPEATTCTWSQAVFEVTDGPRYESFGRWSHTADTSAWTSAVTWRPLPRREYTKRTDYDVIVGTNRHVITPTGWRHEQDNIKVVLDQRRSLAHESGLNTYVRTILPSAVVARDYLRETGAYWHAVREAWQAAFDRNARFTVSTGTAGHSAPDELFELAAAARQGDVDASVTRARALIDTLVEPQASPASASLSPAR